MTSYHITNIEDELLYIAVANALRIVLITPEATAGMVMLVKGITQNVGIPPHELVNIFYLGKIVGKSTTAAIFYMLLTYTP